MTEIEEDRKNGSNLTYSLIRRINFIQMFILPKIIHRSNTIPGKISMTFIEQERVILEFIWKHKRSQKAKVILRKKNKSKGITIPDSKTYYRTFIIKTAWYWHRNRCIYQWNIIEIIERIYISITVLDKGTRNIN